ncbi:MAG: helicase [Helicobacteraceae bacterium]|nr:helicase [Helicobacteraceae bacterium]
MPKNKKKQHRLNHTIAHYFGGDGFDEGIERVEYSLLLELSFALGIVIDDDSKDHLIKLLRKEFSEADMDTRQVFASFFKANNKIYKKEKPQQDALEKTHKIEMYLEMMSEYNITLEESLLITNAFIEVRTKKITESKIVQRLLHIRFEKKRASVEKKLEGHFDYRDRFEFNASLNYSICDQNFSKIQPLKTEPFSYSYLQDSDENLLVEEIQKVKEELVVIKQDRLNSFLKDLSRSHKYLNSEVIVKILKSSTPSNNVTSPEIPTDILKEVLEKELGVSSLSVVDEHIVLNVIAYYSHASLSDQLEYELHISVLASELYSLIWASEELTSITDELRYSKRSYEGTFNEELANISETCKKRAELLEFSDTKIEEIIFDILAPRLHGTLEITPKISSKVSKSFTHYIQTLLMKKQRQQLLARTIRDFKNLFPLARELRRKLILHIGPTNSGKTYSAMQALKKASTGYYLAPLRLLALEGYENLRESNINVSLVTGEEQIIDDGATHISSTIEMLSTQIDVDICVIDEVQMIDDRDRGWAWANAIIGAPAKTIIMTGSVNSRDAIVALAEYLGEPLEIVEFERKNPLELLTQPTAIEHVKAATAIIAFSRKEVLKLKQKLSSSHKVSVIYGALSPEVRREEARRFRSGETEVLVATDAIAMGLNMPIETILFYKDKKFDGEKDRHLKAWEIHQISGRAGRYGQQDVGYVGALESSVFKYITQRFYDQDESIDIPFNVAANLEHIKLVGEILEETSLTAILQFFVENMKFDGPFRAINLESMLEACEVVDRFDLELSVKYNLACAPLYTSSPYVVATYERYVSDLQKGILIPYSPPQLLSDVASSMDELRDIEDRIKVISLYLWLSYRFEDNFLDVGLAKQTRGVLNQYIEKTLKSANFRSKCRICSVILPQDSKYNICERCFKKGHKSNRRTSSRNHRRR